MNRRLLFLLITAAWASVVGWRCPLTARSGAADEVPAPAVRPVGFVSDVQPILERRCIECHGPEKRRSGYRLDVREVALKGGDSGEAAIVPGRGADSPLIKRVDGRDPDRRMPPKGDPLSQEEVAVLRTWVDAGADWPAEASARIEDPRDWWSLKPVVRPGVPPATIGQPGGEAAAGGSAPAAVNPIDRFIGARLAAEGRRLAPEADRRTLIRRVTFDLLGLPPTPEEVAAFGSDRRADAYERLVDRLLASPHYGERWARQWLDVVHYGDTHGYDKDKPRPNAWPYRDYLIRAFNEDRPYARFVQEQIAGDVLFPDTADGIEALGFIAAGPWDFIGHEELPETKIDGKIARHLDRDDMVSNTLGTFASLTVHCAQCHDHKFDPISQVDYFRLQAVFAAVDRTERRYYREPALTRQRGELEAKRRGLERRQREIEGEVARAGGDELKLANERLVAAEKAAKEGQPAEYGFHSAIATRPEEVKWVQVDLGRLVVLDRVVLAPSRDSFNNIGDGFGFPLRFKIEVSDDSGFGQGVSVVADRSAADVANPGVRRQVFAAGGFEGRYVRVTATRLAPRQNDFIFALAELEAFDGAGSNVARGVTVTALDSIEAPPRWAAGNLTDGKAPAAAGTPDELAALRSERERLIEAKVPAEVRESLAEVQAELGATRKAIEAMPQPLVAYVGGVHHGAGNFRGTGPDEGRPRTIRVLARGDVKNPGVEVGPGALSCVEALPATFELGEGEFEGARRAALARWLTDPANPLAWRSIVNRVWQRRFGRGLVSTPNDFGRMGGRPSHPELLDWLAAEFRDGGQSIKTLDRLIVTSATYRQAIVPDEADDGLLAGRKGRRLEAEEIRDAILAVSGRLDRTMYGPGFQEFVVEKPEHSPHYQYHLHDPEDSKTWRRSVYRFLVRSQQEPFMVALDCADPSMRVDRRGETLTPLQALALLNSRLTVGMARHFAGRVRGEAGAEIGGQVNRAMLLAVQRGPTLEERESLVPYVERHGLEAACRVLFNLNEFVFVD